MTMVDANSESGLGAAREPEPLEDGAESRDVATNAGDGLTAHNDGRRSDETEAVTGEPKPRARAPRRRAASADAGTTAIVSEQTDTGEKSHAVRRARSTRKGDPRIPAKGLPARDTAGGREVARQRRDAAEIFASIPRASGSVRDEGQPHADSDEDKGEGQRRGLLGGISVASALAGVMTVAWLGGGTWYIQESTGFAGLFALPPQEFGLFLAGLLAPLVLLWFCIAYFRQSAGLAQQIGAIRETAQSAADHSRVLALTEQHLRLDSYLKLTDFYIGEMAKHAAVLASHTLKISPTQLDAHWQRFQRGDREVFFRLFFSKHDPKLAEKLAAVIEQHPDASKSAHLLAGYYQVFQSQAEQVDRGNLLLEAYRNGFLGDLAAHINSALYGDSNPFSA